MSMVSRRDPPTSRASRASIGVTTAARLSMARRTIIRQAPGVTTSSGSPAGAGVQTGGVSETIAAVLLGTGNENLDGGSVTRPRAQGERSAFSLLHTLAHSPRSRGAPGSAPWLEPLSVVLDVKRDAFAGPHHSNVGPSGSRVAEEFLVIDP